MIRMSLRLPVSLHDRLREVADREGISMNQFVTTAVAEKLSALLSEEYLRERTQRGSRKKYERAFSQVPDSEPVPGDEL